jgi:PAS domain S-box-containing protein
MRGPAHAGGSTQLGILAESVPAGVAYVDRNERVGFVNHAFRRWAGFRGAETAGLTAEAVLGPSLYRELRHQLRLAMTGRNVAYEVALSPQAHQGPSAHEFRFVPHRVVGGEVAGVFMLVRDLSGRPVSNESRHVEADAFLQSALDAVGSLVSIIDDRGKIVAVNMAWREYAIRNGMRHDNCGVGSNYLEVCDNARGAYVREARRAARGIRKVLGGGQSRFGFEYPCATPSGEHWYRLHASGFSHAGSKWALLFHEDVTVTHQALEERARVSEQRALQLAESEDAEKEQRTVLEAVLPSMAEGVIVSDAQGNILRCNRAAKTLLALEEPVEKNIEAKLLRDLGLFSVLQGEACNREMYLEPSSRGSGIWVSATGRPILDENHELEGGVLVFRDITARKKAEEEAGRLAEIVESSEDAIIGQDLDGRITSWNSGARKIYGYGSDEIIGRLGSTLMFNGSQEMSFLKGQSVRHLETEHVRKDGKRIWVSLSISTIRQFDGRIVGVSLISRDITEKRRLEAELLHAQKLEAVGRLSGGIAHDFNNLLAGVVGCAEMAIGRLDASHPARRYVEEIRQAAERGGSLPKQLVAFSRRKEMDEEVTDVEAVIAKTEEMFRKLLGDDVELRLRFEAQSARILCDPGQLQQVLINLIVNARDAMPAGGSLTISTAVVTLDAEEHATLPGLPERCFCLAVEDTGSGIDDALLNQIFEPFFTTKEGVGTGLGLSMVYGIVTRFRGRIRVERGSSAGTRFKIYFPLHGAQEDFPSQVSEVAANELEVPGQDETDGEATMVGRRPSGSHHVKGTRVLVVEDCRPAREAEAQYLLELGYDVFACGDAEAALGQLDRLGEPIEVLVTDLELPGQSGLSLSKALRSRFPDLRVLFTSGADRRDLQEKGVLQDENAKFLGKPFELEQLGEMMLAINLSVRTRVPVPDAEETGPPG